MAIASRSGSSPSPSADGAGGAPAAWTDPREQIEYSVRMSNGRLAPRRFASRAAAAAWADLDAGEQVVSYNAVCDCEM